MVFDSKLNLFNLCFHQSYPFKKMRKRKTGNSSLEIEPLSYEGKLLTLLTKKKTNKKQFQTWKRKQFLTIKSTESSFYS
jgi:hypothetical protein